MPSRPPTTIVLRSACCALHTEGRRQAHAIVYTSCSNRTRHSFPTRRSSDLLHPRQRVQHVLHHALLDHVQERVLLEDFAGDVEGQVRRIDHALDRKSTRLNSSHVEISYAVFCLKKKRQCPAGRLLLSCCVRHAAHCILRAGDRHTLSFILPAPTEPDTLSLHDALPIFFIPASVSSTFFTTLFWITSRSGFCWRISRETLRGRSAESTTP